MMGRIGIIRHDTYSADKLDRILQSMAHSAMIGEKRDYEVLIDGLKIIPRTPDLERFNEFNEFVTPDSECLTLYVYYGASKHCDSYFFYFKGMPQKPDPGLSGVENLEECIKLEKEKLLKEIQHEKLEEQNEELKGQLEDYKKKEVEWKKAKDGQLNSYGEIGSAILASFFNRLTGTTGSPGSDGLTGAGNPDQGDDNSKHQAKEKPQQQAATFRMKPRKEEKTEDMEKKEETQPGKTNPAESKKTAQPQLDSTDRAFLTLAKVYKERCKPSDVPLFMSIVKNLLLNPAALRSTDKQIRNFLNSKPKPKDRA